MIILHFRKITLEQHGDGWEGSKPRSSETSGVSAAATQDRKGHGGAEPLRVER